MAMFYVYVLISLSRSYRYVGMTNDVERRLSEHNKGYNQTTKPYLPFELILVEEYESRPDARKREKYLKSGAGREFLDRL